MKIKPDHYAAMESAIARVREQYPEQTAERYSSLGLSAKRFRWDLLWAATHLGYIRIGQSHNVTGDCEVYLPIYDYANDGHIDTALRRITSTK